MPEKSQQARKKEISLDKGFKTVSRIKPSLFVGQEGEE
jgi:hypothetical protein